MDIGSVASEEQLLFEHLLARRVRAGGLPRPPSTSAFRHPASPKPCLLARSRRTPNSARPQVFCPGPTRMPKPPRRRPRGVHREGSSGAVRLEDRRLLAGVRHHPCRGRALRLEHRPRSRRCDLARWLHHPRPVPQPHHRGVRADPRSAGLDDRPLLRGCPHRRSERVAEHRRPVGGGGHPRSGVLVVSRVLRRADLRAGVRAPVGEPRHHQVPDA